MEKPSPGAKDQRLAALRALGILDTALDAHYDRITRLALRLFEVPIAVVAFADEKRLWFKSHPGLSVEEVSGEFGFGELTLSDDDILVIPDAREDPRFAREPLVTAAGGVRFYAGRPFTAPDGNRLGCVAILDRRPRTMSVLERRLLGDLAAVVESGISALHLTALDRLPIGVYRTTPAGRFLDANPALVAMLGFTDRESFLATPVADVYADPRERARILAGADRDEGLQGVETQLRRKDGALLWVRLNMTVARDAAGRPLFFTGTVEDVTERRLAEEALWESEAQLNLLLEQLPAILWTTDRELRSTMSQGAGLATLDLRPNQLAGISIFDYLRTSDPDHTTIAAHRRALAGESVSFQEELGGRTYESHVRPLLGPDGTVAGALGIALDVTDRKRLENSEKDRTRRLRALMEASLAASTADSFEDALRAIAEGARLVAGAGHAVASILGTESGQAITVASGAGEAAAEGPSLSVPLTAGDGSWLGAIVVSGKSEGAFTEEDETLLTQLAHTASVVAAHRRTGAALLESERRYRDLYQKERSGREQAERLRKASAALGSTLDLGEVLALILRELQGVVPYDTASVQEHRDGLMEIIAGHGFESLEGILGTRFDISVTDNPNREIALTRRPVVLDDAPRVFPQFVAGIHSGIRTRSWIGVPLLFGDRLIGMLALDKYETGFYTAEHVRLAELFAAPAAIAMENARLYAAAREELAERQRVEGQFRQSQKMEAVGRLAGGIAHDFNNLLGVILGYTELSANRLEAGHPARAKLEQVRKAAERAAALTGQLLAFSRKQVLVPEVLDLSGVMADLSAMLHPLIGEDVELVTLVRDPLGVVRADRGQIGQAILNLAVNARDAMPDGGKLIIEAANVDLPDDDATRQAGLRAGPHVMLSVSDTGTGMAPDVAAQIFEPFFTTKAKGQGTGLGLSMVYGFLQQSGGNVTVHSEVGRGTTFRLYLPRLAGEVRSTPAPSPAIAPEGGSETVLVVEDAGSLRELIREILTGQGYRVLEAEAAEPALAIARQHPGPIELLLTDVVMPGMSGAELAHRLRALRSETRVLFMSGYTDDAMLRRGIVSEEEALIQKPFDSAALLGRIRETLRRER